MKRASVLILIPWFLLSGCNSREPTSLNITRWDGIARGSLPEFPPMTITDLKKVQRLYNAALKLPKPPSRLRHCLPSRGLFYNLDFLRESLLVQNMTVEFEGCRILHLSANDARSVTTSFEQVFMESTGLSRIELYPEPRSK